MAREILFKAKRIDNGEWVEGLLTRSISGFPSIMPTDGIVDVEVDINTLCQYTGLTDKNESKIWENDVVKAAFKVAGKENGCYAIGFIVYRKDGFKVNVTVSHNAKKHTEYTDENQSAYYIVHNFIERDYSIKVIGNRFDNPELLLGYNDCIDEILGGGE